MQTVLFITINTMRMNINCVCIAQNVEAAATFKQFVGCVDFGLNVCDVCGQFGLMIYSYF